MKVELTVGDFLRRAEQVYADRTALIDDPDTPGDPFGPMTWREVAAAARSQAAALEEMGVQQGERVGIVSMNDLVRVVHGTANQLEILGEGSCPMCGTLSVSDTPVGEPAPAMHHSHSHSHAA